MRGKREVLTGDPSTGTDYPLDVLHRRGEITGDEGEEGVRFVSTAWGLADSSLSCGKPHERKVGGSDDFSTRMQNDFDDPEHGRKSIERTESNKKRYGPACAVLSGVKAGEIELGSRQVPRFQGDTGGRARGVERSANGNQVETLRRTSIAPMR